MDRPSGSLSPQRPAARSAQPHGAALDGYSATAKALHWIIAILVTMQFVVSLLMPEIGRNTVPGTLINLHLSLGVLILVTMAVRLVHRLSHPVPLELSGSPAWERWSARALHYAFYFILVISPFLGWASASSHSLPVTVFGLFKLPALAAPRTRWANQAGDVHSFLMWTLLALIALHAAAALFHYFVRRDGVLQRMLPARTAAE